MFETPQHLRKQNLVLKGVTAEQALVKQSLEVGKSIVLFSETTGTGKTTIAIDNGVDYLDNPYGEKKPIEPLFIPFLEIPSAQSFDPSDKAWWSELDQKLKSSLPRRIIIDNVQMEHGKNAVDIHQNFRHLFHKVYNSGHQYIITTTMPKKSFAPIFRPDIASRLNEAIWVELPSVDYR